MGFNLKKILRALLFSTSEPLSIKDVQAVIQRYHAEQEAIKKAERKGRLEEEDKEESLTDLMGATAQNVNESGIDGGDKGDEQGVIEDIIAQVPTLLTATQIREAMEEIGVELEESGSVYRLLQSSSGFKFAISKDYSEWVRLLRNDPRPQRLSRAALETLAIVAYRQPVTRAEIEAIRGVNADGALARLAEKELVYVSGRADLPGRPVQYSTTQNFLDFIGANSLDELPSSDVLSPNQISDWIRRASNPVEIKDEDVGLSADDKKSGEEKQEESEERILEEQSSEKSDNPYLENREVYDEAKIHAFPADGAESAGSEEEFENSPDDIDADEKKPEEE